MLGYTEYVLAEGSFSYGKAVAVITAYRNVFIQDDPGMRGVNHAFLCTLLISKVNTAPAIVAGKPLNAWLASERLLRQ